jgi:hypothetical protein
MRVPLALLLYVTTQLRHNAKGVARVAESAMPLSNRLRAPTMMPVARIPLLFEGWLVSGGSRDADDHSLRPYGPRL